jgi:pimeloyl-ACP methyl ester carboxylesterase
MPAVYRKLRALLANQFYWSLDYAYVARKQLLGAISRTKAEQYRNRQTKKPSIILIPGVYEHWQFMKPLAALLHHHAYDVHVVEGLGYNRHDIMTTASVVQAYVASHNIKQCILVAHSKGGLIGKYLLTTNNRDGRILGLVALNTPFSGSRYAYLFLIFKSLRIFIPNSSILKLLSKNQLVNQSIVSIYSKFDPHIPGGSYLEGAKNIQLETHGHFRIVNDQVVHRILLEELARIEKTVHTIR